MGSNEYYLCMGGEVSPLALGADADSTAEQWKGELAYLGRALAFMEATLRSRGLTFYVTWDLRELPSYGRNVVGIVLGDERCLFPRYSHRILATFKQYGAGPGFPPRSLLASVPVAAAILARFVRDSASYLPGAGERRLAAIRARMNGNRRTGPVFAIPLGYFNQVELPLKPVDERQIDISFAGTMGADREGRIKRRLGTPKDHSRGKMLSVVETLIREDSRLSADLRISRRHGESDDWDRLTYSRRLMDTKICLAPRGNSPETFRYFEALRYGCTVISEALPSRWFYNGSPSIEIGSWARLPALVQNLLGQPDLLRASHRAALSWWHSHLSEEALGRYVAARVDEIA